MDIIKFWKTCITFWTDLKTAYLLILFFENQDKLLHLYIFLNEMYIIFQFINKSDLWW